MPGAFFFGRMRGIPLPASAMNSLITRRPASPVEWPDLVDLFRETVRTVNRRDYTPAQLAAWAPAEPDLARWQAKLAAERVLVAERAGFVAGFCAWTPDGYLDLLFVHHAHQRCGVATALWASAEAELRAQGVTRAHTQASVTAQPFFLRRGFELVRHQVVTVRGVELPNAVMEKRLD